MKEYYLSATLTNGLGSVWRNFRVSADIDMETLHEILQILFGYQNKEAYEFYLNESKIRLTNDQTTLEQVKFLRSHEGKHYLEQVDQEKHPIDLSVTVAPGKGAPMMFYFAKKEPMHYLYDFTDQWIFKLELLDELEGDGRPVLLDGLGTAPYEACGGVQGYNEVLDIITNPEDPDYEELRKWVNERGYERFDLMNINQKLAQWWEKRS